MSDLMNDLKVSEALNKIWAEGHDEGWDQGYDAGFEAAKADIRAALGL